MRYLKEYKIFENVYHTDSGSPQDELVQDCRDILVELGDNGFNVSVECLFGGTLNIVITKNHVSSSGDRVFKYEEVSEYLDRLRDYLRTKHIEIVVKYRVFKNSNNTNMIWTDDRTIGNIERVHIYKDNLF